MVLYKTTLREKERASLGQKDVKFCILVTASTLYREHVCNQNCKAFLQLFANIIGEHKGLWKMSSATYKIQ